MEEKYFKRNSILSKFTVGTASVLLGSLILLNPSAHAEEGADDANVNETVAQANDKDHNFVYDRVEVQPGDKFEERVKSGNLSSNDGFSPYDATYTIGENVPDGVEIEDVNHYGEVSGKVSYDAPSNTELLIPIHLEFKDGVEKTVELPIFVKERYGEYLQLGYNNNKNIFEVTAGKEDIYTEYPDVYDGRDKIYAPTGTKFYAEEVDSNQLNVYPRSELGYYVSIPKDAKVGDEFEVLVEAVYRDKSTSTFNTIFKVTEDINGNTTPPAGQKPNKDESKDPQNENSKPGKDDNKETGKEENKDSNKEQSKESSKKDEKSEKDSVKKEDSNKEKSKEDSKDKKTEKDSVKKEDSNKEKSSKDAEEKSDKEDKAVVAKSDDKNNNKSEEKEESKAGFLPDTGEALGSKGFIFGTLALVLGIATFVFTRKRKEN